MSDDEASDASRRRRRVSLDGVRRSVAAWKRIRPYLGVSRVRLALLAVGSVLAGLSEAALLALIAAIATALSAGDTRLEAGLGPVTLDAGLDTMFVIGFALAVTRAALQSVVAYLPAAMSANAMAALRQRLFDSFTGASWPVQSAERFGHFQTLMSTHVGNASLAVVTLGQAISATTMFTTLLVAAIWISPQTAIVLGVLSTSLFLVMRPMSRRTGRFSQQLSTEAKQYTEGTHEVVRLAEETQVFGASPSYRAWFLRLVERVRYPLLQTRFLARLVPVLYQSLALVILLLALLLVSRVATAPLASLAAVVLLLVRSLAYGQEMQTSFTKLHELMPFMNVLRDSVDHYVAHRRPDGDRALPPVRSLGMRGASFSYAGRGEALRDVTFEVAAGDAVGIVGPSGAGKSTLVQLLLRLREPTEGALVVNGDCDARTIRVSDWQRAVAYLPQTPQLIHGSVEDNIRYHRAELHHDDIERAARLAHVHDEIVALPDGYDTVIDDRSTPVSGGQRQRLCLARALAARPSVLVLDEPTSALDVRSELLIQQSLEQLKGQMILFMVAHRMSTVSICDRVMVVADGRLEAIGPPETLRHDNHYFRDALEITRQQSGAL